MDLTNKVAVIVGGGGAIGGAIVRALRQRSCVVIAVGRHRQTLEAIVEQTGDGVCIQVADFTRVREAQDCFDQAVSRWGRLDVVVYSAALKPDLEIPLASYPTEAWSETIATYATGFLICFQEALKRLGKGGHIVAISSAVTRFGADRLPPGIFAGHYAAAKGALDQLCAWGRREAHERNILLSRIAPGAVDTPYHRNAPPQRRPVATIPVEDIVGRIVSALENDREIDEQLVAQAPEGQRPRA